MINLAISIGVALVLAIGLVLLQTSWFIYVPMGLVAGVTTFLVLGRRIQTQLEAIMYQMQKDIQSGKLDRAIDTLKQGYSLKNRHIFVEGQLNSQIGVLYYLKKDHERALEYLSKGFVKHHIAQCMLAIIHYKRKNLDEMKKVMDETIRANGKQSICYGLYAWLLHQNKDKEGAMAMLQKGLKKMPDDEKLTNNLTLLQNDKKMKMKAYGDMWVQFMLERPPRVQQEAPPHMRMRRKAMFR
ncbi:hypothetical protein SCOR_04270 [Sulfidibacter corallicola]|uniref:Tetratricopeptide repeat protein n=1 Tax=Sulfidibacter corallicola TaxID=2818388 RepID=A0A8A4TPV5_SULCO|nr:hypothetical protein [Sulfidibacter corallicola]QTD52006.1 hypothetical protein J3U87_05990 [Sulfidibacter corallicola]